MVLSIQVKLPSPFGITSLKKTEVDRMVKRKRSCFVAMSFTKELDSIYEMIYKPVVEECGMEAITAAKAAPSEDILSFIHKHMREASLVIADLTYNSPNVLYELGLAHSLPKNVIITTQNVEELPFDVRVLKAIPYKNNATGLKKLKREIRSKINENKLFLQSFTGNEDEIIHPKEIKGRIEIFGRRILLLDRKALIEVCSLLAERSRDFYWGMGRQIAWIKHPSFRKSIMIAKDNNVDVKMLSFSEGESNWYVKDWKTLGVPVKYSDHGYLRLVIADKKAVVYGIPFEVKKIKTYRKYCGELIQGKDQDEIIDSWVQFYVNLWKRGLDTPKELEKSIVGRIRKSMENKDLSKELGMIQWIFFDLDKTLYTSKELSNKYEEAVIDLISSKKDIDPEEAEEEYVKITEELWNRNGYHPTLLQIVVECGMTPKELATYVNSKIDPTIYINMDRGLIEEFKSLSNKFKLGIITNNTFEQTKSILDAIGIGEFVPAKYIFTCDNTKYHKPDPLLYTQLIRELKVSPSRCLVIGNRYPVDLRTAKQKGMKICEVDGSKELLGILQDTL